MKHILLIMVSSFAAGIVAGYYLVVPYAWPLLVLCGLVPALMFCKSERQFLVFVTVAFLLLGAAYERVYAYRSGRDISREQACLFSTPCAVIGTIDSVVETKKITEKKIITSFQMTAHRIRREKKWGPVRGRVQVRIMGAPPSLMYGDRVRLWGTLERPRAARNPGEFDYRQYLQKYRIDATMMVYGTKSVRVYGDTFKTGVGAGPGSTLLTTLSLSKGCARPLSNNNDNCANIIAINNGRPQAKSPKGRGAPTSAMAFGVPAKLFRTLFTLRNNLKARIERLFPPPYRSIMAALLVGTQSEIPRAVRDDFVATGTVHILSIGGMHIATLCAGLYFLTGVLRMGRPARVISACVLVNLYAIVVGVQFPVMRAALMGSIVLIGIMLDRGKHIVNALYLVLFMALCVCPEAAWLPGFQLSFLTVIAIVIMVPLLIEWMPLIGAHNHPLSWFLAMARALHMSVYVSGAVFIGVSLIVVYHFHVFSLTSIIANALIVPLSDIIILSGMSAVCCSFLHEGVAHLVAQVPLVLLKGMMALMHVISRVPYGAFYVRSPHLMFLAVYYGVLVLLLTVPKRWLRGHRMAWISIVWLLAITVVMLPPHPEADMVVHVLDTRRGDVLSVQCRGGKNFLINTGGGDKPYETTWTVHPFLMSRAVYTIDHVFITSWHKRQWGGAGVLDALYRIRSWWVPPGGGRFAEQLLRAVDGRRLKTIREGDRITLSTYCFVDVLFVPATTAKTRIGSAGVVVKLVCGKTAFLVCPNLDPDAMNALCLRTIESEVMLVPERGAYLGQGEETFIRAVKPHVAIIISKRPVDTGPVERMLAGQQSTVYCTADHGAITVLMSKTGTVQVRPFVIPKAS